MLRTTILLAALALTISAVPAQAGITASWPLLAFDTGAGCELRINGNGRFIEIGTSGMIPGEALRLTLSNGKMKPIAYIAYANGKGQWSKLYIPFRFGQEGGTIAVRIAASRCTLDASVPWTRGVRTIR